MDFERLLAEGDAEPVEGWDFSWFAGRATEERPSWGYAKLLGARLATVSAALDLQTGGGEVLASVPNLPANLFATEGWAPNATLAAARLPGTVVLAGDELPFRDNSFELISSRHPVNTPWAEVARVLEPGGTYFCQGVGAGTNRALYEYFLGPQPGDDERDAENPAAQAGAAGFEVLDFRHEKLRLEFFDVGAVVYFLRKVLWTVPGFTVDGYRPRLAELHRKIETDGSFVSWSRRYLIEARKPAETHDTVCRDA